VAIDYNTRLGRYEVRHQLGESAIGEVYLAHDPAIGRDVVIKVLPPEFAIDEDRLRRFELEVQAIGQLNHPNILAFNDVETIENRTYIVYELPERAETLRYQLLLGPLPSQVAIDYAKQIAQGLIAASDLGIIHCNINPDNILITSDKCVRILDFGLGQLTQTTEASALIDIATRIVNVSSTPVLETMGYKSPEQIREQQLDHRWPPALLRQEEGKRVRPLSSVDHGR
jgi:serine/threonine protein kinase